MANSKYSVSWEDYRKNICNGLCGLQQNGDFVDMTLAAEGHHVMAHKMVLSLVSPYIRDLVGSTVCHHPVIFLSKVSHETLQSILEYAYTGEVVVANEKIQEFLLACKELRIRGLEGSTNIDSARQASCTDMDMDIQQADSNTDIQQANSNTDSQQANSNTDIQQANSNTDIQQVNSNTDIQEVDSDTQMEPPAPPTVHATESPSFYNDYDSYSTGSSDEDNNTLASIRKPVPKPTIDRNAPDPGLKFTISNQGSAQIVLNRFLYNHRNTRKNGETLWRCFNYTKSTKVTERCRAFVVLKDNHVVQRACSHNHPFHDDIIIKRVQLKNMFTTMSETLKVIEKKAQENIEKKAQENIEKKAQENIETNEAINQRPVRRSIRRLQSDADRPIEYIEII